MSFDLFSLPLRFSMDENSVPPTDKSDFNNLPSKRKPAKDVTDKPRCSEVNTSPSLNKSNKNHMKNKNSPKKKASRKRARYQDYDGELSMNHDIPLNWSHIETECQSSNQSNRSLVCYEDQIFLNTRSKIQCKNENFVKKDNYANCNKNKKTNKRQKPSKNKQKMTNLIRKDEAYVENLAIQQKPGSNNFLNVSFNEDEHSSMFNKASVGKRSHEKDDDVKSRKLRKVCEDRNVEEKQTVPKNLKKPMSKKMLKKMEKTRIFKEKMKEKQAKEATHVQGVQKRVVPCKFFINGCCKNADCTFSHDVPQPKKDEQCKFFVMAQCTKGDDCLYRHGEWPCKFFHAKMGCKIANCKFSHEPLTEISKKWLDKILEEDKVRVEGEVKKNDETSSDSIPNLLEDFYGTSSRTSFETIQSIPDLEIMDNSIRSESSIGTSLKTIPSNNDMQHSQSKARHDIVIDYNRHGSNVVNSLEKLDVQKNLPPDYLPQIFSDGNLQNQLKSNEVAKLYNNFNLISVDVNIQYHISLFGHFKEAIEMHRKKKINDSPLDEVNCNEAGRSLCSNQSDHIQATSRLFSIPLSFDLKHNSSKSMTNVPVVESNTHNSMIINSSTAQAKGLFSTPLSFSKACKTKDLESNKFTNVSASENGTNISEPSKTEQHKLSPLHTNGLFSSPLSFPSKSQMKCISHNIESCKMNPPTPKNDSGFAKNELQTASIHHTVGLFSRPLAFKSSMSDQQKYSLNESNQLANASALGNDTSKDISLENAKNKMQTPKTIEMADLFSSPLSFSSKSDLKHDTDKLESNKVVEVLKLKNNNSQITTQQSFSTDHNTSLFSASLSFSSSKKSEVNKVVDISELENNSTSVKSCPKQSTLETAGLFSSPLSFSSKFDSKCNPHGLETSKNSNSSQKNIDSERAQDEPQISSATSLTGLFSAPLSFNSKSGAKDNSTKISVSTLVENDNDLFRSEENGRQTCPTMGLFSNPLSLSSKSGVKCNSNRSESNKIIPMSKSNANSSISVPQTSASIQTAGLFSSPLSFSSKFNMNSDKLESDKKLNVEVPISSARDSPIENQQTSNMQMDKLFSTPLSFASKFDTQCDSNRLESDKTTNASSLKISCADNSSTENLQTSPNMQTAGLFSSPLSFASKFDRKSVSNSNQLEVTKVADAPVRDDSKKNENHVLPADTLGLFSAPLKFSS